MVQHISESLSKTLNEVSDRKARGGVNLIGLTTGFKKIDKATGGLRKNNLYIVAGRAGMGKSALGLSMLTNTAKAGHTSLYVSLEMSNDLLSMRLLSGLSGVEAQAAEYGKISDEEFLRLQTADAELSKLPVWFHDEVSTSENVIKVAQEVDPEIVYIDYGTLLSDRYGESEQDRVSRIVQTLRHGATTLDIPIVLLAQLNRQVEYRDPPIPTLSDLRDSGAFEQDASVVLFVYRPAYYASMRGGEMSDAHKETDAVIYIGKNRFGPTGKNTTNFYPKLMKWSDD